MKTCPLCHQPIIKGPRRVCADCGQPIRRHDKWFFGTDGRARHRFCEQPGNYAKEPAKAEEQPTLIEEPA